MGIVGDNETAMHIRVNVVLVAHSGGSDFTCKVLRLQVIKVCPVTE